MSMPPIELDESKMGRARPQRGKVDDKATASLKAFSAKIAKSAEQFGHDVGQVQEKKKMGARSVAEPGDYALATMVVHRDGNAQIPQSQLIAPGNGKDKVEEETVLA